MMKPCPFCGINNIELTYVFTLTNVYLGIALCADCGARGPLAAASGSGTEARDKAEEIWNKRSEEKS